MFEGVRANGNSSNRLALHREERSLDGVCDGNARNRRPSRRTVRSVPAKENARRVPLLRQRGADFGRFAVRRIASEQPQRTHARYTQSGTCRQTVRNLLCKTLRKASRSALPFATRIPTTVLCASRGLAADSLSGGAFSAAKRSRFPAATRRPRSATEAAYKGPVTDPSALSSCSNSVVFSRAQEKKKIWPTHACSQKRTTDILTDRESCGHSSTRRALQSLSTAAGHSP